MESAREDLPRISVESSHDWDLVHQNYRDAAYATLDEHMRSVSHSARRDAIGHHIEQLVQDVFSIARPNLRVNGQNYEDFNEQEKEVEPFDEALDRHIWSLSDQRLNWDKDLAVRRRRVPNEIESKLEEVFVRQKMAAVLALDLPGDFDNSHIQRGEKDTSYTSFEDTFAQALSFTKELAQVLPVQLDRSARVKSLSSEITVVKL